MKRLLALLILMFGLSARATVLTNDNLTVSNNYSGNTVVITNGNLSVAGTTTLAGNLSVSGNITNAGIIQVAFLTNTLTSYALAISNNFTTFPIQYASASIVCVTNDSQSGWAVGDQIPIQDQASSTIHYSIANSSSTVEPFFNIRFGSNFVFTTANNWQIGPSVNINWIFPAHGFSSSTSITTNIENFVEVIRLTSK